jgi:hypothetical protein
MATSFCQQCHQRLPRSMREGVSLTELKASVFDAVKRRGASGISTDELNRQCFGGRASKANIRVHIHQINEALEDSGVRIRSYLRLYQVVQRRRAAERGHG